MLRKICSYLAIMALFVIAVGNSALAASNVRKDRAGAKSVVVDENKDFSLYTEFLLAGGKHAYKVKVGEGKEVKIKIHAPKRVALNVQTPGGQTKNYEAESFFEIKFRAAGEYVVELESLYVTQYSLEVLSK